MRRFFAPIEDIPDQSIRLDKEQSLHLRRVLRLRPGDSVNLFDGEGNEYTSVVESFSGKESLANLKIIEKVTPSSPESSLNLTLGVAILKSDKFDLVVKKAVELGVVKLIPITTLRTDVKLKNAARKIARWEKITIESSKQCGRAKLMEISQPDEFRQISKATAETVVMFSEQGGKGFSSLKSGKKITALVGPEGGWDDSEIDFAKKNDFSIVTLGGRILRAETAAISVATILQHRFGDLN